jgi:hypothetical protein
MVTLMQLWAPIILSGVLVFIASSLVHMVIKWHAPDYKRLPNEDDVRAVMRKGNPAPGQYITPWCGDMKDMKSPEMQQKFKEGPVGFFYIRPSGMGGMGAQLGQWFIFNLVVSGFVACVLARTTQSGAVYMQIFPVAATVAFLGYGAGSIPGGIWMGKPWIVVFKELVDGLLYGLLTAGAFGWLWPR